MSTPLLGENATLPERTVPYAARGQLFTDPDHQRSTLHRSGSSRDEQALVGLLHGAIALAGRLLQAGAVEDGDVPAPIPDDPGVLQRSLRDGHRGPADAEHVREELLGELE